MTAAGAIVAVVVCLLVVAAVGAAAWVLIARRRAQRLGLPPPTLSSLFSFGSSGGARSSPYGPPQPAPGGVVGWFNDKFRQLRNTRNRRTAAGAYEEPLQGGGGVGTSPGGQQGRSRGFGPLDPDEAWDAQRVAEEDPYGGGYYGEELQPQQRPGLNVGRGSGNSAYEGSSYTMNLASTPRQGPVDSSAADADRGRARGRSPGLVPGGGVKGKGLATNNPFDDDAEPSNISLRGVSPRPLDTSAAAATAVGGGLAARADGADSPTERKSIFRENM